MFTPQHLQLQIRPVFLRYQAQSCTKLSTSQMHIFTTFWPRRRVLMQMVLFNTLMKIPSNLWWEKCTEKNIDFHHEDTEKTRNASQLFKKDIRECFVQLLDTFCSISDTFAEFWTHIVQFWLYFAQFWIHIAQSWIHIAQFWIHLATSFTIILLYLVQYLLWWHNLCVVLAIYLIQFWIHLRIKCTTKNTLIFSKKRHWKTRNASQLFTRYLRVRGTAVAVYFYCNHWSGNCSQSKSFEKKLWSVLLQMEVKLLLAKRLFRMQQFDEKTSLLINDIAWISAFYREAK